MASIEILLTVTVEDRLEDGVLAGWVPELGSYVFGRDSDDLLERASMMADACFASMSMTDIIRYFDREDIKYTLLDATEELQGTSCLPMQRVHSLVKTLSHV